MSILLSPFEIKSLKLKNRVVMSPMCMHSAGEDGLVTAWHKVHYGSRAQGQVGLVFPETLAVQKDGRIGPGDLGIWNDGHIQGLKDLVDIVHEFGAKIGAQIGHAGRQADLKDIDRISASAIPFTVGSPVPRAIEVQEIPGVIESFRSAARRVLEAGFDVLEIHAAHGYLLNQFLSPLANHRNDSYGGDSKGRYRLLREVIEAVKEVWESRPLFVRISSTDYVRGGNTPETFIEYGRWMKEQGVDLIDCSSGGISKVNVDTFPNYQVPAAEMLRRELSIMTSAVGLIQTGRQAEEILQNERADLVFIGREMLRDPFWVRTAADDLKVRIDVPVQFTRYGAVWLNTATP